MYYSYELLCRKPNGKFAIIWLLSNSRKVPVREVMSIPFPDIIDDVENIIVRRYPDHLPESIGSRFSLYLSSKLCYGIVLALKTQLNCLTSELKSLCLFSSTSSTERSIPEKGEIAGPSEEPDNKRRKTHESSFEVEVRPAALPFLEDLEIDDLVHHLEVNGAAVRVPVERITLRDEVPDIRLVVEDEEFGEISELDLERFFLSHRGEERVPDTQEQPPAHDRTPVPAPATEQLPRTSVETETHPAATTESQITVTVIAPELPQRPSSTPLIPAAERTQALPSTPAVSPIPAIQPAPALARTPPIEPAAALAQTPAIEPAVALAQTPAIEPAAALAQTPAIEPAPALLPTEASPQPPLPAAPTIQRISASPFILDQDIQLSPPRRRRRRRRVPFQDEQTQISLRDLADRLQSTGQDTMRVQEATEDALNIEQYRKIVPAQKLLGSVRVALLPDRLKNLFSGHMHTRGMPTESMEEELLREPGSFSTSLSSLKSESLHLSHSGRGSRLERSMAAPPVLETITEGAEADAEVHQIHLDALAERIPEVSQIIVEEVPLPEPPPEELRLPEHLPEELRLPEHLPEELRLPEPPPEELRLPEPPPEELRLPEPPPGELRLPELPPEELPRVQPQGSEMQGVPHEEEMASTEKSEEEQLDLEAQEMMQKLQSLWDAGTAVTFGLICPPSSNDKISALAMFDLLLHMNHEGMIRLKQNLPWPPPYPRPPIYILPWQ